MAWRFVRNALKVYLSVSRDAAAQRIMRDGRAGEAYANHAAAVAALGDRRLSEAKRYRQLYGVEIADLANYDLVVITDDATIGDVAGLVLAAANRNVSDKFWLPKMRVVPMSAWQKPLTPGASASVLPLTVVHNFGFYFGEAGPLNAALAAPGPFLAYRPEAPPSDAESIVDRAKRILTPGGLGQWSANGGAGRSFAALLGPARP
jgi:hypothetical protein